jgi:hypothetical protein
MQSLCCIVDIFPGGCGFFDGGLEESGPRMEGRRNWDTDRRSHCRENIFLHDFCPCS